MSKLSVLISVYKKEKVQYLNRALMSVWDDQILKPNEIILIKDGPLNSELDNLIDDWQIKLGKHMIVLKNESNLGLTKSLNKGIKFINSKYVARMDSDDISLPNRFLLQTKYLDEHEDVDIVGGSIQEFDEENENIGVRYYPLSYEEVLSYMFKASPLAHPATMMRMTIFNKVSYNEKYRLSQDIALWFDAVCAGFKINNISEIILLFRRESDVFKRRSYKKAWNEFQIYMRGIHKVYGPITYKYLFAICRLVFRLMPIGIVKMIYESKLRTIFLQGHEKSM